MLNIPVAERGPAWLPESVWRAARVFAMAVIIGVGINHLYWALTDWNLVDMEVYWDAALRLRAGEALYEDGTNTFHAYRYTPWFAFAWVPLTFLPKAAVGVVWSAVLLATTAAILWPLVRIRTGAAILLIAFMLPLLIPMVTGGNVQPLMVAMLLFGLPRRSGPLWIAVAASLKATPILFVLVYVGRGEWTKVAATLVLTAVLVLPTFAFEISAVTLDAGPVSSLPAISPMLYVLAVFIAMGAAVWVSARRPKYGPLAVSATSVIALPRLFLSDMTTVLAGLSSANLHNAGARRVNKGGCDGHSTGPGPGAHSSKVERSSGSGISASELSGPLA